MSFAYGLNEILEEIEQTRNKIAVESKIRPATIYDMCEGKTKRLELSTINTVLNTINQMASTKGIEKIYKLDDLFPYTYEKDSE